ncbi:MAG: flagellar motor protein MotB [Thermoguttaceae bacterium]|jgi:chemotaxis protein MotB
MAGHGGGAWKVAYADFVTAMMAFFMVMWITAQGKEVKEAVADYFKDPAGAGRKTGGLSPIPLKKNAAAASMKKSSAGPRPRGRGQAGPGAQPTPTEDPEGPGADKNRLMVLHDGKHSSMGSVVQFVDNTANLTEEAKKQLQSLIPMLVGKPNKIEVRGHTSRRPLPPGGPFHDPWQLSFARCMATLKYLEEGGVEPKRVRLSQAGPFEPRTLRVEPERQAQNSRVEVYLLSEFAEDSVGTPQERAERFKTP